MKGEVLSARKSFFLAMEELHDHNITPNPWKALRKVFPVWHEQRRTQPTWHRRHVTRPAGQRPGYVSTEERTLIGQQQREAARKILEQWARRFGLVTEDDRGKPVAAGWVLGLAETSFEQWAGMASDHSDYPRIGPPLSELSVAQRKQLLGGFLIIPMAEPLRLAEESWSQFKKRARAALTLYLRRGERTLDAKTSAKGSSGLAGKRKAQQHDHYVWLVLYQCCQWTLKRIMEEYGPHVSSEQAIWNGISNKARLIGIRLRPKGS
jgi:hypothetical protein